MNGIIWADKEGSSISLKDFDTLYECAKFIANKPSDILFPSVIDIDSAKDVTYEMGNIYNKILRIQQNIDMLDKDFEDDWC